MVDNVTRQLGLWNIRVGTAVAVMGYGLLFGFWKWLPGEVPLWYSHPWGQSQLAEPKWLLIIPSLTLLFTIVSTLAQQGLVRREPVLTAIILTTSLVVQILGVFALLRILLLVL
jgi:hypothetical protein